MRKYSYFPVVLIILVVTMVVLAACSGVVNRQEQSTRTAPGNIPASPVAGECRLALLLPGLSTDDSSLQAGVLEAASQNECQLDVYAARDAPGIMVAQIEEAVQTEVGGVIIKPIDQADVQAAILQISQPGLPVIVIGAQGLPAIHTNRVVPDLIDGARQAAGFACAAIHEQGNIVQLADSQMDSADSLVSKAFSDGIKGTCPEVKLTTITLQDSEEGTAKRAMLQVLSANPDISAVFAFTAGAMDGAVSANQEAGILGVITMEFGQEPGTAGADRTSTVDAVLRSPGGETGRAAVRVALAQANGAAAEPKISVPMQISVTDISFQLPPDPAARRITIGVLLPDGADPFYQQVYRGLLTPARALDNVTLKVRSGNNDPQKMSRDLDWMVNAGVDAILISPIEDPDLLTAIDEIVRSGTPLVTVGLKLENDRIISQVSFDEYAVGYRAGEYLCAALDGIGTLADVYDLGNPEQEAARSRGLQDYQQENCPEVKIISQAFPAGSQPACQGLLRFVSDAGPFTGMFAHSGELWSCAVDSSNTRFVVGIGTSPETIQSIQAGKLSATLGQYPYEMGLIAMETTLEYLYGKSVEPNKPFPVDLITRDSLK